MIRLISGQSFEVLCFSRLVLELVLYLAASKEGIALINVAISGMLALYVTVVCTNYYTKGSFSQEHKFKDKEVAVYV